MRKYGKWLLVLGVLAASPAAASADGFLTGKIRSPFGASSQELNQAQADAVAAALQSAQVSGSDIEIEVRDGVAVLSGRVRDAGTRAVAQRVAASVRGIQRVENNLTLATGPVEQASAADSGGRVTQAAAIDAGRTAAPIQRVSGELSTPAGRSNQDVAQEIAGSLSQAGLTGYDVEIRFNNGVATLAGEVSTLAQRQAATAAVSQVPGVESVNNQLRVAGPVTQTAYRPGPMPLPMAPAGYAPMMQPGMAMDPSLMPSPTGYAPTSYNHPHLPGHAWPSYAQYPNSAAVSYPTQYSASAWPYIGPFYPYPQVPLGWREVSLEWDDGYWQLNFNKEKDKWYWVLNPHNW